MKISAIGSIIVVYSNMKTVLTLLILISLKSFAQVVDTPNVKLPPVEKSKDPNQFIGTINCDARFPEGNDSLRRYIQDLRNQIPENWADSSYNKKGYVGFIVEIDSTVSNVKMVRSISPEADALIIQHFQKMPLWIPACTWDGPIRSRNQMPITFIRPEE